jgi:tetratricopeptide (TPR) repeat protein
MLRLERPIPDDVYAEALGNAGAIAVLCDDFGAARPLYEASIAIARRSSDPVAPAGTLTRLGNVLMLLGDMDGAQRALEEALARVQAGDAGANLVAHTLNSLAGLAKERGDAEAAERWNRACFQAAKDGGDAFMAASAQANLGESAMLRGDLDEARALHAEARATFERLDFRVGLAINAQQCAEVALAAGDLAAAGADLERAMVRFADLDDRRGVAEVAVSLVYLAVARKDWPDALRWIGAARAQHDRLGIALSEVVRERLDGHEATAGAHVRAPHVDALRAEGAAWTQEATLVRARVGRG